MYREELKPGSWIIFPREQVRREEEQRMKLQGTPTLRLEDKKEPTKTDRLLRFFFNITIFLFINGKDLVRREENFCCNW